MGSLLPDRIWLSLFCPWCKKNLVPQTWDDDPQWLSCCEGWSNQWVLTSSKCTYSVAMFRGWWCGHFSHPFSQWVDSQVCRHRGFRDAACAWLHAQPGLGWWDLAWWNSDTNWFCIESTKRRIAIPGVFLSFSDFSQVRYIYFDTGNPAPVLTKNWHT